MKKIEPSQFLELILKQQKLHNQQFLELRVRDFNKMIDELSDLNYSVRFGYSDLIEFVEKFYASIPYKSFSLNISYTEELMKEVKVFNKIYEDINNLSESTNLWEKFIK